MAGVESGNGGVGDATSPGMSDLGTGRSRQATAAFPYAFKDPYKSFFVHLNHDVGFHAVVHDR